MFQKESLAPNRTNSQALLPYTAIDNLMKCLSEECGDVKNVIKFCHLC